MAGFFYQTLVFEPRPSDPRVRFLPNTITAPFNNIRQGGGGGGESEGTTASNAIEENIINPFSSLDKSLDKFLSCSLHQDQNQKIIITASSNGYLLCSLASESDDTVTYYLVNPVTMEWVALPKLWKMQQRAIGFVCKGDYPSLDLVEYTIVIVSCIWRIMNIGLNFKFFSSGDNQWREYSCPLIDFTMSTPQNPVIVRTAGGGIVVYLLVIGGTTSVPAIVVFDLNKAKAKGDNNLLQIIETPGPDRGVSVFGCDDYIREFDDGVIHYVRICCSTDFEFWVLNIETRDWCLKHRASLKTMMKGYSWTNVRRWDGVGVRQCDELDRFYHIHDFHPMNPNLIFLTLYGRMVCYNLQTGTLELVYDFLAQNMLENYYLYVYQWPCWPPLF